MLTWVETIHKRLFQLNFNTSLADSLTGIDANAINLIWACDGLLSSTFPEPYAPRKRLREILVAVRAALKAVLESELPGPLKDYLLRQLYVIEAAILDYDLQGLGSLKSAVQTLVGMARTEATVHKEAHATPEGKDVLEVIARIGTVITAGYNAKKLLTDGTTWVSENLLPLLTGDIAP